MLCKMFTFIPTVTKAIVSAASALLCYELESIKIIYSGHVKATAGIYFLELYIKIICI